MDDEPATPGPAPAARPGFRWSIIAPAGLLVLALALVVAFDLRTGGEAEPPPLLGALGTPVRSTYVPIPPTTVPVTPTVKARTTEGTITGTPDSRDGQRRADLLLLLNAMNELYAEDGEYPSTNNNMQTLCVYEDNDAGCKIRDVLDGDPPADPLGDAVNNGYFYRSNGTSMQIFAQLETDIPAEQECKSERPGLTTRDNVICITAP